MDIINSTWLIQMLNKASNTPQGRMLALFDILDDWLNAPGIAVTQLSLAQDHAPLKHYLSAQATAAGAAQADMLANQLYFMVLAACQEKPNNPTSLACAKTAAQALITAQTQRDFSYLNSFWHFKTVKYGLAASVLVASTAFGLLSYQKHTFTAAPAQIALAAPSVLVEERTIATPAETAALVAQIEMMRHGNCQLIEALQLPDAHKKIYFDNIVNGQISSNRQEQLLVNQYLEKVRCNYTPRLMANSK
jgi:hypothetical protein